MKNFKDAIQVYPDALKQHGYPAPNETMQISVSKLKKVKVEVLRKH